MSDRLKQIEARVNESDDRLILMPDFGERAEWTSRDSHDFLSCDLCGDDELTPWGRSPDPQVIFGKMYWTPDGYVACEACKDKGEHLKEAA